MKPIRVTREYFLEDRVLKAALGLPASAVVLRIERKTGLFKGRSGPTQTLDLQGSLVTVYDPADEAAR